MVVILNVKWIEKHVEEDEDVVRKESPLSLDDNIEKWKDFTCTWVR